MLFFLNDHILKAILINVQDNGRPKELCVKTQGLIKAGNLFRYDSHKAEIIEDNPLEVFLILYEFHEFSLIRCLP